MTKGLMISNRKYGSSAVYVADTREQRAAALHAGMRQERDWIVPPADEPNEYSFSDQDKEFFLIDPTDLPEPFKSQVAVAHKRRARWYEARDEDREYWQLMQKFLDMTPQEASVATDPANERWSLADSLWGHYFDGDEYISKESVRIEDPLDEG